MGGRGKTTCIIPVEGLCIRWRQESFLTSCMYYQGVNPNYAIYTI